MSKRNRIKVEDLGRFLRYVLGYRPDEFALVPDAEGYVTYKALLRAIHEVPDRGYVRESHIHELLMGKDRALFQTESNRIRAVDRHWSLDFETPCPALPKILFAPIRKKALPVALEKGLRSIEGGHHILFEDRETALRVGRRRDQNPVLLEVMADAAQKQGIRFFAFGDLFLTAEIPPRFIAGPPLPREFTGPPKVRKEAVEEPRPDFTPGTFLLDEGRDPDRSRRAAGRKQKGWKEEARRSRRKGLKK